MLESQAGERDVRVVREYCLIVFQIPLHYPLRLCSYAAELNGASMFHLRIMLRQLLSKADVPRVKEWEETLLKLSLRVASHLALNPRAPGASMDVRKYVKIKKIPGGSPRDSECVDGAVITKNVAHKNMTRDIRNPRIMLVTFPFDYHRVEGQFMSFDPLLAQEKDYLFNLVSRVAALRPHIVLVERSVSRLALEYLLQANIAVARTVKNSALQFVSRATQAQVLTSMDRLVTEPQMGHCSRFRLQTFEHPLIPGRRKTYMRFEGCSHDTACTIILRGGDLETLKKIKAVTSFMMFIVRNLKMETFLWKDTFISVPQMTTYAAPSSFFQFPPPLASSGASAVSVTSQISGLLLFETSSDASAQSQDECEADDELSTADLSKLKLSKQIQKSVQPYLSNFISISATLRFPPPYPIWRMKELDDQVRALQIQWEDEGAAAILREEANRSRDSLCSIPQGSNGSNASGISGSDDLQSTPIPRRLPSLSPDASVTSFPRTPAESSLKHSSSRASMISNLSSNASLLSKTPVTSSLRSVVPKGPREVPEISLHSALHRAQFDHEEQQRVWAWYLRKNNDDFVVQKYQCIHVRQFIIPTLGLELEPACFLPKLVRIPYYGENDCTLGQFIEDSIIEALDSKKMCTGKGCKKHLAAHSKVYVHHERRVVIATQPWIPTANSGSPTPAPDKVASYSVCRVCRQKTPFIPISDEALKYSFGKFLELHFYPAEVLLIPGAGCEHNVYRHHERFFAWRGMTVRFQTDGIDLYEAVFPPMRTIVHLDTLLDLKNRDYEHLLSRNAAYWQSVTSRITQMQMQFKPESPLEKSNASMGQDAAAELFQRAEVDNAEITRGIHDTYQDSPPTDTLALGSVRSRIQNKVVQWDLELERFEKAFLSNKNTLLPEKDLLRVTGSHHFRRIYDDFFRQYASSASEVDEKIHHHHERIEEIRAPNTNDAVLEKDLVTEKEPLALDANAGDVSSALVTVAVNVLSLPTPSTSDDGDSDSTISAPPTRAPNTSSESLPTLGMVSSESENMEATKPAPPTSKLPRWQGPFPSVAERVKMLEASWPEGTSVVPRETGALRSHSTSDNENLEEPVPRRRGRVKSTIGKAKIPRQLQMSDFDRSYAANVGPRHLTHSRRPIAKNHAGPLASRIPTPVTKGPIPSENQRRVLKPVPVTENSISFEKNLLPTQAQPSQISPPSERPDLADRKDTAFFLSKAKGKVPVRGTHRPMVRSSSKATPRYAHSTATKVSNIARQFERMSKEFKESERANRRYAVMKGRKARPVATAAAKVEVFSNFRDAAGESEDSSESLSEADDEDEEDEFVPPAASSNPSDTLDIDPGSVEIPEPASEDLISSSPNENEAPISTPNNHIHPPPVDLSDSTPSIPGTSPIATSPDSRTVEDLMASSGDVGSSMEGSTVISTVSGWWRNNNHPVHLQYPL
jgi:1-phosphatidylinositol-3-phosphate 5-kinase